MKNFKLVAILIAISMYVGNAAAWPTLTKITNKSKYFVTFFSEDNKWNFVNNKSNWNCKSGNTQSNLAIGCAPYFLAPSGGDEKFASELDLSARDTGAGWQIPANDQGQQLWIYVWTENNKVYKDKISYNQKLNYKVSLGSNELDGGKDVKVHVTIDEQGRLQVEKA